MTKTNAQYRKRELKVGVRKDHKLVLWPDGLPKMQQVVGWEELWEMLMARKAGMPGTISWDTLLCKAAAAMREATAGLRAEEATTDVQLVEDAIASVHAVMWGRRQ